ncbi:hypothetical protein H4Q26_009700 [Puccinia striiformis f. sp. tritici PST-130]|nr:hypothetical protein H4Q26_009700 [Puccinia striiformis f. sp. tritici PST-130]
MHSSRPCIVSRYETIPLIGISEDCLGNPFTALSWTTPYRQDYSEDHTKPVQHKANPITEMARSSTSPFPTPSQPPSRRSTRLRTPVNLNTNSISQDSRHSFSTSNDHNPGSDVQSCASSVLVKLAALNYRKLANGNNLRSVLLQKKPLSNKNQKHGNGIKEHRRLATMNLI